MKRNLFILFGLILCLTGCSSGSSISSANLACSSIEQYLDDKTLALKSAADGGSAEEWVINTVGELAQALGPDPVSREIYNKYFDSLIVWSQSVDRYVVFQNQEDLRSASGDLEKAIDQIIPMCEKIGWSFQKGWR